MRNTGNTVLVTGGGSGIGRGIAEAFHQFKNEVVISGRREENLKAVATANPGMQYVLLDQSQPENIARFASEVRQAFPKLNVLVNNAGMQQQEYLREGVVDVAEKTLETNLLGPIRLTAAFMRHLLDQPEAVIMNVSSALAMVPVAGLPSYCASKAALHSYTQSLRYQLRDSSIQVIEIIPPWVQTELQGESGMNPRAMPLKDFLNEVMDLLQRNPNMEEIVVDRAMALRHAARGDYAAFFERYNENWAEAHKS